ncbi:MAG: hypothetical protein KDK64_06240 [Chlamydiia bacterium]|nr:hypothetical protein [Chlamydiia bacterium]
MEKTQSHCTIIQHQTKLGSGFFGNFGKASTFQQREYALYNPHKNNTFIQEGDSTLTKAGKVLLGFVSLTSSLWVSALLDAFHSPDADQKSALEKDLKKEKETMLSEVFTDIQRNHYRYNGQSFHDRGFQLEKKDGGALLLEEIALPKYRELIQQFLSENTYEDALKLRDQMLESTPDDSERILAAFKCLNDSIEHSIKDLFLPEFYNDLERKYGTQKAVQILDLMHQSLPTTIRNDVNHMLVAGKLDQKTGPLSHSAIADDMLAMNTATWNIDTRTGKLLFTTQDLKISREGQKEDKGKLGMKIPYASVPFQVSVDLNKMKGTRRIVVQIPKGQLTKQEGRKLVRVWDRYIS